MSSYLCFLCHSTINDETNEETREKYKEVVGIHLCPDSHLCYICCHVLHKLFMFRSICLKRSLEYPVLFSEKGTINLHRSDIEINILCPEDCDQYQVKQYQYDYNNDFNENHFMDNHFNDNQYVELEDDYDYFNKNPYELEKVTENFDYINDKTDTVLNDVHFHNFNQNLDYLKYPDAIPPINNIDINKTNESIGFNYNDNRNTGYCNELNQNTYDIPLDDYENQIKHHIINEISIGNKNNDLNKTNEQHFYENENNHNETRVGNTNQNNPNRISSCNISEISIGNISKNNQNVIRVSDTNENSKNIIRLSNASENSQNGIRVGNISESNPHGVRVGSTSDSQNAMIVPNTSENIPNETVNRRETHFELNVVQKNDSPLQMNNLNANKTLKVPDEVQETQETQIHDNYEMDDHTPSPENIGKFDETESTENIDDEIIHSSKKKKKGFKKIVLSMEEQKRDLEKNRKDKKYIEAEFKCYNCALGFLFKDTYQAHMMRHEESNGEFRCDTCTLRFSTHALLRTHVTSHSVLYKCLQCGDVLKPRAKRTHPCFKTKIEENVTCHLCGNLYRDSNGLQQHLRRVHTHPKASNRLHSCTICNENFTNPSVLKTHMIKHINRKFQCDKCPAVYKSPYTLAQHKKKHELCPEKHYCTQCDAIFDSRKNLLAHFRRSAAHQNTVLECPICGRIFATPSALDAHAQRHAGARFPCPHCAAAYCTRKSLLRHVRRHENRDTTELAVCHLCGNSFKGKNKLTRHLKQVCEKAKLEEQLDALYE